MPDDDLTQLALDEARTRMQKTITSHRRDLDSVRTGRAQPSLVDALPINYYGAPTPLNQLASISAPEARLLVIQPWDKNAFDPIAKSIQLSDLGLNPQSDGIVIRLVIPELTEDRRKQLVKQVAQKNEAARVALRNIRRDTQDELRTMVKDKDISQDEERRAHDQLDKIAHGFSSKIDEEGAAKERELLEV
ncbi:MAG: ribosome recycling factor [Chloroflexi bacterium]|jgi:ribosome recycling factor|nr:MAG: ribosome recycling factor [Chloroflexota bacterium]